MKTDIGPTVTSRLHFVDEFDTCLEREWLLTNGRGAYASGTIVGVPTRRYHGLLVAAARPPLERWLLLSAVMERVGVSGRQHDMASFEFERTVHPRGYEYQVDFEIGAEAQHPWVRFIYEHDGARLTRQIVLVRERNEVLVQYRLEGPPDEPLSLELLPLTPMRDYHATTHAFEGCYATGEAEGFVTVDAYVDGPRLWLKAERTDGGPAPVFEPRHHWWYGFVYREEAARGLESREDLFVPGCFRAEGRGSIELLFRAAAGFGLNMQVVPVEVSPTWRPPIDAPAHTEPGSVEARLERASDAFLVKRTRHGNTDLTTILAGYHWFGDWGRDTFISLPGLLLETGRFAETRQVLEVFASSVQDGLIPNRFSDYGDGRDYNSVDASLWFVHDADAYCRRSGDEAGWSEVLEPACRQIVDAFCAGTRYRIRVEPDGLVACGDLTTQVTWMDGKHNGVAFTPRHGKPVEVNALWYHVLCLMEARSGPTDPEASARYAELAAKARASFLPVFWNESARCLYDVVRDDWRDMAIRPNQVLAVSLPHSPLPPEYQRSVLAVVERELLTPYGLRTLSPQHPSYHGRYQGNAFERDAAYHQGTVWPWLIGPYVEACLRVYGDGPDIRHRLRELLTPLIEHLDDAGLGYVSEIFDGDPPHMARGCIAQAWSTAELLRAWRMTEVNG